MSISILLNKTQKMKNLIAILILAFILFLPSSGMAVCEGSVSPFTAASCSRADINDCLTVATTGDTINVPAGTPCDWSSDSSLTISKEVKIIGAGTGCPDSCGDQTKILTGTVTPFIVGANNVRISGITFEGDSNAYGSIKIRAINTRIDHCHFKDTTVRGITVGDYSSEAGYDAQFPAVIDGNRFYSATSHLGVVVYGGSKNTVGSWADTLSLGYPSGTSFAFIENNVFVNAGIDGDTGARYVIRYNNFTNSGISAHGQEVSVALSWRSTHGWEIYGNYFNSTVSQSFQINIRGGTGVIWGNSFNGEESDFKPIRYLYEMGDFFDTGSNARGCNNSPTPCNGVYASYHENQTDKYGYICYQQIGTTGSNGITSSPAYQWGNSYNGTANEDVLSEVTYDEECNYQHVQFGRDVIKSPKSGYSMYTCPHPLVGSGSCDSATAGRGGYHLGNANFGSGATHSFSGGSTITWQ